MNVLKIFVIRNLAQDSQIIYIITCCCIADHIFDMNATNNDVFNDVVRPIVDAAVNGFNGTIFAYGQTSSGKTYTMMGTSEEPGIIPLAVEHIFDAIANIPGREFLLRWILYLL